MKSNPCFSSWKRKTISLCTFLSLILIQEIKAQKFEPNYNIPNQNTVLDMASNSKFVFASTGGSGLFRSPDEGATWQDITSGTGGGYFFSLLSANDSLYTGSFGSVFFSSNNGANWTNLNLGLNLNDNVLALAKSSQYIFAGVKQKGVYARALSSGSWLAKNSGLPASVTVNHLLMVGSTLYAGTDQGLYVSGNNGSSWQQITNGLPANILVNKLYRKNNIIIAGTDNGFYKSSSNGSSWTYSGAGNSPVTPNIVSLTSFGNTFFGGVVGSNMHGLMLSSDQGSSWTAYTANAAAAMPYYSLTTSKNFVFAGIGNSILRYSEGPVGVKEEQEDKTPISLYPNPCKEVLSFSSPGSEIQDLIIYDLQGRKHMEVQLTTGQRTVDVKNLPPGFYSAFISNAKTSSVVKFLKD